MIFFVAAALRPQAASLAWYPLPGSPFSRGDEVKQRVFLQKFWHPSAGALCLSDKLGSLLRLHDTTNTS
eukprot:1142716-Pelagomonas_calceolata.AAC.3